MQEGLVPVATLLAGGAIGFIIGKMVTNLQRPQVAAPIDTTALEEAKTRLSEMEKEIRDYTAQVATLNAEKTGLDARLKDQSTYVKQVQEEFQVRFENLAHKIFDEKNTQSKKNLQELLNPLKEDLTGFKKHISDSFGEHNKEQFALKKEIENIVRVSNEMKFQTENLSKALKGDVKTQGTWGEVILERILEASGLRKGEDYIPQAAGMGLKHPEHGSTQKPDFVIKLPENKHAIIDSKVSLTSYERFCAEENETTRAAHLAQFLQSVKAHVKGLEERRYQDTDGLDTPDYAMLFMPIEGAYALAMQQDGELHSYAWDRKIIIVCPSTLFAILKIIASMWKLERQNKNADEIAQRGGRLYDKVVGFVEDMVSLGKKLDGAQSDFDKAFSKLSKGTGNILRQTEQLRELGVKNAKSMPAQLIGTEEDETVLTLPKDAA